MTETTLLKRILVHASGLGLCLFRNQVGKYRLADGRWLSSGLCVGSSDLIGWTPVVITPEMVGRTVAVFTAIETKSGPRKATIAQACFLDAVQSAGGIATIAHEVEDTDAAVARFTA